MTRKLHIFLDIIRVFSLSNERMRNTSWQIVVAMLHGLYIRDRNCVIYGYFFCVYRSEMLCAHLQVHVCTAVLRSAKGGPANVRVSHIHLYEPWCRVFLKSVLKCVPCNFGHAWDQFYNNNNNKKQNCLQGALILLEILKAGDDLDFYHPVK